MLRMYKTATVLSALMEVYTIPCQDRVHINVMVVLQNCTNSVQVMAGSCTETFPTSSDGTFVVSNVKVEEHIAIKEEEDVNVKTERLIFSEEVECIDIKYEDCLYSEGEKEEEEEDVDTKEDDYVEIKEELNV